jgi:hypothetical protein
MSAIRGEIIEKALSLRLEILKLKNGNISTYNY